MVESERCMTKTKRLASYFEEEMVGLFKGRGIKRKVHELAIFIRSNQGEIWLRGSHAWNILCWKTCSWGLPCIVYHSDAPI